MGHMGYEVSWLWYDILVLALFSTAFLIIAYLALFAHQEEVNFHGHTCGSTPTFQ